MQLVQRALDSFDSTLPQVPIKADRMTTAKRLWRATAEDGTEFGIDVDEPLKHGTAVHATDTAVYVIEQAPEPVLRIPIDVTPAAAAVIGWAVGNMHFTIEAREKHILAPDDSGLRNMLDRVGIDYSMTTEVFKPHRFASIVVHSHEPANNHPYIRPLKN